MKPVFLHISSVESTNDYMKQLIASDVIQNWTVLSVDHQTNGRGQRGASWDSHPNQNLLCSVYVQPGKLLATDSFKINQWVSLALYDCLTELGVVGVKIKWPNDILINGKKVAGVLVENTVGGNLISDSILGIGLNVNSFPDFSYVTSIAKEVGSDLDPKKILKLLVSKLQLNFSLQQKPKELKTNYLSLLFGFKINQRFRDKEGEFDAKILDVKSTGELILNLNGATKSYGFKEIELVRD